MNLLLVFRLSFLMFLSSSVFSMDSVKNFEVQKYVGKWFQVYANRFSSYLIEKGGSCVVANYGLFPNGTISVLNEEIDQQGKPSRICGTARVENPSEPGRLTVFFNGRGAPYWVIDLGPEVENLYDYSVVSDPKGTGLFVLARDVERFYREYDMKITSALTQQGFKLIPTKQDGCFLNQSADLRSEYLRRR